jgi:hypothetical protein
LLKLYPRAWRARYGDEFLALLSEGPLTLRHTINVVSGAVDARLSGWRRPASDQASTPQGGAAVMQMLKECSYAPRVSTRDSAIGAAVLIGVSALGALIGVGLDKTGYVALGEFVIYFAFFVGVQASMLFTYLKGRPARVQVVMTGVPLVLVAAILGVAIAYTRA